MTGQEGIYVIEVYSSANSWKPLLHPFGDIGTFNAADGKTSPTTDDPYHSVDPRADQRAWWRFTPDQADGSIVQTYRIGPACETDYCLAADRIPTAAEPADIEIEASLDNPHFVRFAFQIDES